MARTSVSAAHVDARARGVGLLLLAVLVFSVMDALIKWLAAGYPVMQIVFFRSIFAFIPCAILIARSGGLASLATRKPGAHVLRSMIGVVAMVCMFYAFSVMRLVDVVAIGFSSPLFVTALSVPLLGEFVGWRRWSAVGVGFMGVLVMVRPGVAVFEPTALIALAGALCMALAMIAVRRLCATETSASILFYFTLATTTVSGLAMPFQWVTPDAIDLALLACVGLLGGTAHLTLVEAYRRAEVSLLAPFDYSAMIWVALFGYLVWDESPDAWIVTGVAIVIASGLYILRREALRWPARQAPMSPTAIDAGRIDSP